MKRVMVRYRVKVDRAGENQQYVENVYRELAQNAPDGLRYVTFKLEDGVSFIHIASIETVDGSNPLQATTAFQLFTSKIAERCEEPPVAVDVTTVGAYRVFGE